MSTVTLSALRRLVPACILSVVVSIPGVGSAFLLPGLTAPVIAQQIVGKACDNCGRGVSLASQVGGTCPHCGAYWGARRDRYVNHDAGTRHSRTRTRRTKRTAPDFRVGSDPVTVVPEMVASDAVGSEAVGSETIVSPGGRYRMTRMGSSWLDVHDTSTGEHLKFPHDDTVSLRPENFSTDEELLATVAQGWVHVWELSTGALRMRRNRGVADAAFLPREHTLAVLRPGALTFLSVDTGKSVYGSIRSGRAGFQEVVLRHSGESSPVVVVRTGTSRTGIYDLHGNRLSTGQRIPQQDTGGMQLSLSK